MNSSEGGFKSLMRQAGKSGARYCLILGPDELARGEVVVKHLESGRQQSVVRAGLVDFLQAGAESND